MGFTVCQKVDWFLKNSKLTRILRCILCASRLWTGAAPPRWVKSLSTLGARRLWSSPCEIRDRVGADRPARPPAACRQVAPIKSVSPNSFHSGPASTLSAPGGATFRLAERACHPYSRLSLSHLIARQCKRQRWRPRRMTEQAGPLRGKQDARVTQTFLHSDLTHLINCCRQKKVACHERQKPQEPTPQAPIRNASTTKCPLHKCPLTKKSFTHKCPPNQNVRK